MQVVRIDDSGKALWDDYVGSRASSVSDLYGWRRVLRETYGINSYYLVVESEGSIVGALSIFEIKHPIFGHYLTTAPFASAGGIFFEFDRVRDLLVSTATGIADDLHVDYLLIRSFEHPIPGLQHDEHYRTAVIELSDDPDKIWTDTLPGKARNQVRRGIKEGFTVHEGAEYLKDFHAVFHEHMRNLGSPAHGERFYENILGCLPGQTRFMVLREGTSVVAGALLFEVNGTAMNLHTVALSAYNRRCPNYLLYWEMIKSSCLRGNSRFDMGRSEADSGNLKFKKNWGAREMTLSYDYYLPDEKEMPYLDPRNPMYRLPVYIWKKLPLKISGMLGPWLIKGIA